MMMHIPALQENWVWLSLLIVLMLPIGLLLLLGRGGMLAASRRKTNVTLFKNKEADINEAFAAGLLSEQEKNNLLAELQGQLLEDAEDLTQETYKQSTWAYLVLLLAVLATPVAVIVLYQQLGAIEGVQLKQQLESMAEEKDIEVLKKQGVEIITKLEAWVEKTPDDYQSQALLARAFVSAGRYEKASKHFAIIHQGFPEDPDVIAQYAQSLYLANNRQMTAKVKELLERALTIDRNQSVALGLLGVDGFAKGDFLQAAYYWERTLFLLNPNSPAVSSIVQGLSEAKMMLKEKPDAAGIPIELHIDSALLKSGDEVIWLFVRSEEHSAGPPVAVKKIRASWLPTTVWLSSYDRILPSATPLPEQAGLVVTARLSRLGLPEAAQGDVESQTVSLTKPGEGSINLLLNKVVGAK